MVAFFHNSTIAQITKISFEASNFETSLLKAKNANKLVFIDVATEWCGPCKRMDAEVFTDSSVAAYFNVEFVNIKIDAEKGEGIDLAKKYQISAYPTLIIVNSDGKLVHRTSGFKTPAELISFGKESSIPEATFAYLDSTFSSGNIDSTNIVKYLELRESASLSSKKLIEEYFSKQPEGAMFTRTSWIIIRDYISGYRDKYFRFLLNNEQAYIDLYTKDSVKDKIQSVFAYAYMEVEDQAKLRNEIALLNFLSKDYTLFHFDMTYYQNDDWQKWVKLAVEKGDKYFDSEFHFSQYAAFIYENSNDKLALQKAEKWLGYYFKNWKKERFSDYSTYAKISYKLGKNAQAKTAALKALEIGKSENSDWSPDVNADYYKLLIKISKLK